MIALLLALSCAGHELRGGSWDKQRCIDSLPEPKRSGLPNPLKPLATLLLAFNPTAGVWSSFGAASCSPSSAWQFSKLGALNGQPHLRPREKSRSLPPVEMHVDAKSQRLSNGFDYPLLGFGTWGLRGSRLRANLASAVKAGYRLIDTSSTYGNEADIGRTLREVRGNKDLVLQSKISPRHMGREKAREAALNSIKDMGRLDVLVIHWPGRSRKLRFETWQVLEELYSSGRVRAIGVSNFLPEHIEALMKDGAKVRPMINQFELHPLCQGRGIVEYCHKNDIAVQSYSTLGGGPAKGKIRLEDGTSILLGHPSVVSISKEIGKSCACVCLRWAIQQNFGVIPKSRSLEHIQSNAEIFDFELTEDQMHRLQSLDEDHHFAWDPKTL